MISRQRMMTISCHNRKPMPAAVQAAAGDNQRIEVKMMDKMLYAQVLITCTTINVISLISLFGMRIADKLYDRRKRKKKEREEQAAKTEEAAQ